MCGICGLFSTHPEGSESDARAQAIARMSVAMARRGPDREGSWQDPAGHVRLAFRRLAILDLSPHGDQPMVSPSGRSVLVFNGEIYNFVELRERLSGLGHTFRSSGDSAVLLAALETWGLDALPRLEGMFALAWYELESRRLTLARDPLGIKPLYYRLDAQGMGLAFGSQYDQMAMAPSGTSRGTDPEIDPAALSLYLHLSHLPAPWALHRGIHQLEAGSWLQIDAVGQLRKEKYWSLPRQPVADLGEGDLDQLEAALEGAVQRHRIADVPLGVFLSGGIDSPLVTAMARKQTPEGLQAFTLGNPGWGQDEEELARRFAGLLDVEHHVLRLRSEEAEAAIDDLIAAQHEPFADFSLLPTLLLSRFARQHIKVALSGDGGDELFFGYERPRSLLRDGWAYRWPLAARYAFYGASKAASKLGRGRRLSDAILFPNPGDYYRHVSSRMTLDTLRRIAPELGELPADFRVYDSTPFRDGDARGGYELANFSRWAEVHGQLQRGLKKVDMASMHHGLEVRVPLLDHRIVELSCRFDPAASLGKGRRKHLLRRLLGRYVPPDTVERRKLGFAMPLGDLLRGPLRQRVEETLLDGPLFPDGVFVRSAIEGLWRRHLARQEDHKWALWSLLCLQWWATRQERLLSDC